MSTNISDQISHARRDLLDLTARNRLLNTPLNRRRSSRLDLHDELTDELFRLLVHEQREMSFLPAPEVEAVEDETPVEAAAETPRESPPDAPLASERMADEETPTESDEPNSDSSVDQPTELAQPAEGDTDTDEESGPAERHIDRKLQTQLEDEKLQGRLLRLFYDARTLQEEQGVNSLYLAMGFLEWCEPDAKDKPRFAPLLLIPVELHRRSVNARFRLKVLDDEISTNLSLKEKLKVEFSLQLPDVPDPDDLVPGDYFDAVKAMIAKQPNWRLHRDRQTLWFFSFSKFLMFRDLDPDVWPNESGPTHHRLLRGLLGEPIDFEPPMIGEDDNLDERLAPQSLRHVMDADGSQAAAIEEVRLGRNLVIQGPPGTGKSQSITNLISTAVSDGKTVLFVSEKLAALEVVKSRLDCIGLGDMCLELHSHKANRKAVLEDLSDVLELGRPVALNVDEHAAKLTRTRDQLNAYVDQLHEPMTPQDRSPYELSGTFVRLLGNQTKPFEADLPDIAEWSASDLKQHQETLSDIGQHIEELGRPCEHVWFGVQRTSPLLPTDIDGLKQMISDLTPRLQQVIELGRVLLESLNGTWTEAKSLADLGPGYVLATRLGESPEMDRAALSTDAWTHQREDIDAVVKLGHRYRTLREKLSHQVAELAWQTDVSQARIDLAASGRSWFRWFHSGWRAARRTLLGIARAPLPESLDEQLRILDDLSEGQSAAKELKDGRLAGVGQSAFGARWRGLDSDWTQLGDISDWERRTAEEPVASDFRQITSDCKDTSSARDAAKKIEDAGTPLAKDVATLMELLSFDVTLPFDVGEDARTNEDGLPEFLCRDWSDSAWRFQRVAMTGLLERLDQWKDGTNQLGRWLVFQRRLHDLAESSLAPLLPEIHRSTRQDLARDRLTYSYCEAGMRRVLEQRDAIAGFDGVLHTRRVHDFRRLDHERIRTARHEVASAHYARIPTGGDHGQLGVVRTEIRKKRRHMQIRRLINEAGHAVQALKPVFMMSPLSIAQFLEPGALEFDLLVIDEASQVRPVEAFGAVMRCQQMVVVGDNRQLPPTAFFDHMAGADDADDETQAGDVESILDLCDARGFPQRMLRWHYRSRHHSLISVSNHEFYDNRLFVIPSPEGDASERGLKFQFVEDGVFDRGGTRTNQREACVVAEAMIEHARRTPNLTLGVGTFSVSQRDAVLDELERLRRENADAERFFSSNEGEPWFVKNLENIQGDERDVILISVGYGPDGHGKTSMNFGPLNRDGGERRLNVLITRSRERCVVYSSLRAEQIDLSRTSARGVAALRTFLRFAESGGVDSVESQDARDVQDFERHIADELSSAGWKIEHQVGTPQFHVDVAVVDPNHPGSYLMGIECDGRSYRSARWARDRDRLQQSVLERHGWSLFRAWSTDWFHGRANELEKLLRRLEDARAVRNRNDEDEVAKGTASDAPVMPLEFEEDAPDAEQPPNQLNSEDAPSEDAQAEDGQTLAAVPEDGGISRETASEDDSTTTTAYQEANFEHDLMSRPVQDAKPGELARVLKRILNIEGPVHAAEVERRVVDLWRLSRTGRRINDAIMKSLHWLTRQGTALEEDDVYWLAAQTDFPVRDRSSVTSATLRKPEMLPRPELRTGVEIFVQDHVAVTRDETARGVARMLGFRSTSPQLREVMDHVIDDLVTTERLSDRDGQLRMREPSPSLHAS